MSRATASVSCSETDIKSVIFEYLVRRGHLVWRDPQKPYRQTRGVFPESKGKPDVMGIARKGKWAGKFFGLEIKKPGGTVSQEQTKFLLEVLETGNLAFTANCLDDVRLKGL